jgi:hypothetical protein
VKHPYMLPTIAKFLDSLYQVARELLRRQHVIAAKSVKYGIKKVSFYNA